MSQCLRALRRVLLRRLTELDCAVIASQDMSDLVRLQQSRRRLAKLFYRLLGDRPKGNTPPHKSAGGGPRK
jgi:hypothetical protein